MKNETLMTKLIRLFKKIVNRETIAYGVAGVLTTIVNFVSYEGLYRLGIPNLTSNALAWFIAVTFAYLVNKINVFQSKSFTIKDEASKVTKFYGARLVSLGVEQLGMFIFVNLLGYHRLLVKASLAIIVIILNYIFSKLFIFNKDED